MSLRTQKVAATIERVIGEYLSRTYGGGKVPISIVRIDLSPDLKQLGLWLSLLGEDTTELKAELIHHTADMQRDVAAALHTKFSPRIHLHFDEGLKHATLISDLLKG